jgi:hypothetical protein
MSIHTDEALAPRGPWAFLGAALPGGFTAAGWGLLEGWGLLALVPAFFWAGHLLSYTSYAGGYSGLPAHWGEQIGAKDIVDLFKNGEVHAPIGFMAGAFFLLGLILVFACGWRMQAKRAGLHGTFTAWILGLVEAMLVGFVPLGIVYGLAFAGLSLLTGHGVPMLSWTAFVLKPLAGLAFVSALNVQWWLLRLGREGSQQEFGTHLGHGFLRLWSHPVQWFVLVVGGAALRLALHGLVLWTAWRMGGSSVGRVWAFAGLELAAAVVNGWILGWMLRVAALYWRHDLEVRRAIAALKAMVKADAPAGPAEDIPVEVQG